MDQLFFSTVEESAKRTGLTPLQKQTLSSGTSAIDIVHNTINQKGLVGTPENKKATAEYKKRMNKYPKAKFAKVDQEANMNKAFRPRPGSSD